MQRGLAFFIFLYSLNVFSQINSTRVDGLKEIKRFAFGSCNNQNAPQPLWNPIMESNPDLFVWGGDIIYADWDSQYDVRASYQKQFDQADYRKLRAQIPVIGIWDDHDYGADHSDGNFAFKKESQEYFLDFMEVPKTSPRRVQEGIYTSHTFGKDDKQIKFLLLDNRYFRNLEKDYPLLGSTQWKWLEHELKTSQAAVHFIMSGLTIISPAIPYAEEWAHYPKELDRLLSLIQTYKTKGVVFLSGDKHFASIYRRRGHLEFLSSGMTHIAQRNVWWYLGRRYETTFFGLNYGLVDMAWEGSTPVLSLVIKNRNNNDIHPRRFKWIKNRWIKLSP